MPRQKLILALVAAVLGIATTLALGNWQTRRGDAKLALQALADAAERAEPLRIGTSRETIESVSAGLPRKVQASGVFDPAGTVYLDNRALDGAAGYYVITPLIVGEGLPVVLVDRGWQAHDRQDRARVPSVLPPPGRVSVEGVAVARPSILLELGSKPERRVPGIWQNFDYSAYEKATGRTVARFVVRQSGGAPGEPVLRREWLRPASGVEKHRGYAVQWYSLSALIAVLAIYFGWNGGRRR